MEQISIFREKVSKHRVGKLSPQPYFSWFSYKSYCSYFDGARGSDNDAMVSHLIPASLTILTPLLLGRNSSVVARSHSRRKGFNGDFWENPCHDEKRGKIPKQCREAFLTTLSLLLKMNKYQKVFSFTIPASKKYTK